MRKIACLVVGLGFLVAPVAWANPGEGAKYVDGTAPDLKKGQGGTTHADGPTDFVFEYKGGEFRIPYLQITGLKYGTKGHMAVRYSVFLGVHPTKVTDYTLTIEYRHENKEPGAVIFKLEKDRLWNTLINLQSKSGQKILFDSQESCKHAAKDAPPGQVDCSDLPPADPKKKG